MAWKIQGEAATHQQRHGGSGLVPPFNRLDLAGCVRASSDSTKSVAAGPSPCHEVANEPAGPTRMALLDETSPAGTGPSPSSTLFEACHAPTGPRAAMRLRARKKLRIFGDDFYRSTSKDRYSCGLPHPGTCMPHARLFGARLSGAACPKGHDASNGTVTIEKGMRNELGRGSSDRH
jgi:hypothetical protein